jgi:hypothetical protein
MKSLLIQLILKIPTKIGFTQKIQKSDPFQNDTIYIYLSLSLFIYIHINVYIFVLNITSSRIIIIKN